MARAYLPLYFSYAEPLALLPDDERGRLVIALLEYTQSGTLPEFAPTSATAMLFAMIRSQIDRDTAKYNAKCDKNRDNINSRWNKRDTTVYDGIRTNTNDTKEKEKEKKKEKENEKEKDREKKKEMSATSDELKKRFSEAAVSVISDWLVYKQERNEEYEPTGLKYLLSEIEQRIHQYGEQAACDVIRLSMANGWRGIVWDKIKQEDSKANGTDEVHQSEPELSGIIRL